MNKKDAIQQFIDVLEPALAPWIPASSIRTEGGDSNSVPIPSVTLSWDSRRMDRQGATPLAGYTRDVDGNATGFIFHRYNRIEIECEVRSYSESDRDDILDAISDALLPYEKQSSSFDPDTFEWEVGDARPRTLQAVEPDWYIGVLRVGFGLVTETTQSASPLLNISDTVHNDL